MADEKYHRMGGPADKHPPLITYVLQKGTLWRGMAHGRNGAMVDLGDIGIIDHARKGIEVILFKVNERRYLPYPDDKNIVLDRENHLRIGDKDGNLVMTMAPTSAD